jgi:biotin--protein ligase
MMLRLLKVFLRALISRVYVGTMNILIYSGPGVGPKSLANTVAMLSSLVAASYEIKIVGPDTIIGRDWLENTALLVMPGGADSPYMEKLAGVGNQNIREYVQNGGKYLGICAGAYYAADSIEFAKGDSRLEVVAERELKFYPGIVQGPTYAGFDYEPPQNIAGMRAAKIFWQAAQPFASNREFVVYYNGGGHFVTAEQYPQVTILASYDSETPNQSTNHAAIIECKYGSGTAILSGLHFEWGADSLEATEQRLHKIKSALQASEEDRLALGRHLLQRLGIVLRGPF